MKHTLISGCFLALFCALMPAADAQVAPVKFNMVLGGDITDNPNSFYMSPDNDGYYCIAQSSSYLDGVAGSPDNPTKIIVYKIGFDLQVIWQRAYIVGATNDEFANHSPLAVIDANGITIACNTIAVNNLPDILLFRINLNGEMLWSHAFGKADDADYAGSLINTSDGGYAIAGTKITYSAPGSGTETNRSIYLIKTDALGSLSKSLLIDNLALSVPYNNYVLDWGSSLIQTSDGNYVITGNTTNILANSNSYAVILKVNLAAGVVMYQNSFRSSAGGKTRNWYYTPVENADQSITVIGITNSSNTESELLISKYSPTLSFPLHRVLRCDTRQWMHPIRIKRVNDDYLIIGEILDPLNGRVTGTSIEDNFVMKVNTNLIPVSCNKWTHYTPLNDLRKRYLVSIEDAPDGYLLSGMQAQNYDPAYPSRSTTTDIQLYRTDLNLDPGCDNEIITPIYVSQDYTTNHYFYASEINEPLDSRVISVPICSTHSEIYCYEEEPGVSQQQSVAEEHTSVGDHMLSIYPNPGSGQVNVSYNAGSQLPMIVLSDISGNRITSFRAETARGNMILNMNSYAAGIYIISLETAEGKTASLKYIKY